MILKLKFNSLIKCIRITTITTTNISNYTNTKMRSCEYFKTE